MPGKDDLHFIHNFQKTLALIHAGKIKGVQLRLDEKPGHTVANRKGEQKWP